MNIFPASVRLTLLILITLFQCSHAQFIEDISASYSRLVITESKFSGVVSNRQFVRQFGEIQFGKGPLFMGLIYQNATREDIEQADVLEEDGFMLTAGYSLMLASAVRVETYGRIGIFSETDPSTSIYATDTDLRLTLIAFSQGGFGYLGKGALFPSASLGVVVNRYGRTQALAGSGVWWRGLSIYASGFYSFNGVEDIFNPGSDADTRWAKVKNAGITFSGGFDFKGINLQVQRNITLENGGNDLTVKIGYSLFVN